MRLTSLLIWLISSRAAWSSSRVDIRVGGVFLDELAARRHLFAHQHGEDDIGIGRILDGYLFQGTVLGIHRGIPKLLGVHFTQPFVPLCMYSVLVAFGILVNKCAALPFIVTILLDFPPFHKVERRCSDIHVSAFDEWPHVTEEKRENQRVDMATIHIRIRHQDYLVIPQFLDIELFGILFRSD